MYKCVFQLIQPGFHFQGNLYFFSDLKKIIVKFQFEQTPTDFLNKFKEISLTVRRDANMVRKIFGLHLTRIFVNRLFKVKTSPSLSFEVFR